MIVDDDDDAVKVIAADTLVKLGRDARRLDRVICTPGNKSRPTINTTGYINDIILIIILLLLYYRCARIRKKKKTFKGDVFTYT